MEQIRSNFRDILHDLKDESNFIIKFKYGSLFSDLIVAEYTEQDDPNEWLSSDNQLIHAFEDIFTCNSDYNLLTLYRGTDYYTNLSVGNIIDYTDRFVSWSSRIDAAIRFTSTNIIFRVTGKLRTLTTTIIPNEAEHIMKGGKFIVTEVRSEDNVSIYELLPIF